ncbi:MAG: sigma-70 family RNA polymerase sigma factor [Planctomycetota bacterium]
MQLALAHSMDDAASIGSESDATLLRRFVNSGDSDAFANLLSRHHDLVCGTCARVLSKREQVEDAVQVTWLTLLKHAESVRGSDCGPWLYRVALRSALRLRKEYAAAGSIDHPMEGIADTERQVLDEVQRRELMHVIDQEIDRLPEKCRDAFVMHYLQGLARGDIAERLNVTVPAVKSRLERARAQLRSRLARRGLTLGTASLCLIESVGAEQIDANVDQTILDTAVRWQDGEQIHLRLDVHSDFYGKKEWEMNWGSNAFRIGAAAAIVTLLMVVYSNGPTQANGADDGRAGAANAGNLNLLAQYATAGDPPPPSTRAFQPVAVAASAEQEAQPERSFSNANQPPEASPRYRSAYPRGIPNGAWTRESPLGTSNLTVDGNKLTIRFAGTGELSQVRPVARGEYSVASDGTIYGIFHSVDPGFEALSAADLSDLGEIGLAGFSDVPFSSRIYSDDGALVIKTFTLGVPREYLVSVDDGDNVLAIAQYAGLAFVGEYDQRTVNK